MRAFAFDADGQILQTRAGTVTISPPPPPGGGGIISPPPPPPPPGRPPVVINAVGTQTTAFTPTGTYATQHYAYVNGQQVGEVDEGGGIDVLSGVTGFSNAAQGTSNYVVQAGDSLTGIAQQVYGDASLWYVVADANGLTADSDLTAGQTLKLPQVTTHDNTAETFKPYNPNEIQGSTTPSLPHAPQPPPSAGHGCNALAEIVVIAVVIVVSIYTAGAAAGMMGAATSATGATTTVAIGAGTVTAAGSTMSAGALVMAGAGTSMGLTAGEAFAAAAIGGAVGDAAGQVVGDAEGIHQGFSFGEMAGAGLRAGITAGLAGEITNGESIQSLADADTWAADAKIAGVGAAGAVGSYMGEKLVGQPAQFSWANVVAAALSTEATTALGLNSTLAQKWGQGASATFGENVVGGMVNGAIDSETARLLGGDAANGKQITEDAFGNALGNAAIAGIQHENQVAEQKQPDTQNPPVEIDVDNPQVSVQDINMPLAPIGPVAYTVQSGDSLSGILGTSDPAAIGAFMQANGLTSSTIYPGEQLAFPSGGYTAGDEAIGQATLNVDNQRIAALPASQSYGTGIQWMSAGEQEEAFNAFPNATYGTSSGVRSSDDVVGDYINMMNQVGSYAQAAISGGYAGFQAIPGKMDAAVAGAWTGLKNWASAAKFDAVSLWDNGIGTDLNQLQDGLTQLPGAIQALPGEAEGWGAALGARVAQDGVQLYNYLRSTPGTQIAYDTAYTLTSNAPMIALGAATDGLGDVGVVDVAGSAADSVGAQGVVDIEALNHATALDFYMNQAGFSEENALQHIAGIDLSQPVTVTQLDGGTILQQYVGTRGLGNYFAPVGTTPLESGLAVTDQSLVILQNEQSVMALQSITKQDFLFPPGEIVPGSGAGGATQYFIPNKATFKPIGGQ